MSGHFEGRVALVTGGSRGIGRAAALRLASEAGDELLEGKLLSTLGKFAMEAGEHDEALGLYREAAAKMKKLGRERQALIARIYQGLLLVEKREYFKAIDLLRTELTETRQHDPYIRGHLHIGLAKVYFGAENYRSARTHARSSRDCAEKLEDPSLLFLSLYYLWQVARRERTDDVAKMHFERLKYYRGKLDIDYDEIQKFDRFVSADRAQRVERGATS